MIEAMACGTPVLAFRQGSVAEIIDQGVTGAIIDTMDEAMMILPRVIALDHRAVRRRFEQRFSSARMATDCGLPFAAQAAVHIGARDDCADATTDIGKKVEWTGS
jgi:glycosyltransferase involved in cell wall biosynthesis